MERWQSRRHLRTVGCTERLLGDLCHCLVFSREKDQKRADGKNQ